MFEKDRTLIIIFLIIVFGGLGTWIIGHQGVHIGASGVIYGMIGFLGAGGIFRRSVKTIIISVIVFLLYGGSVLGGILPTQSYISWESHLCGLIVGVILAKVVSKKPQSLSR